METQLNSSDNENTFGFNNKTLDEEDEDEEDEEEEEEEEEDDEDETQDDNDTNEDEDEDDAEINRVLNAKYVCAKRTPPNSCRKNSLKSVKRLAVTSQLIKKGVTDASDSTSKTETSSSPSSSSSYISSGSSSSLSRTPSPIRNQSKKRILHKNQVRLKHSRKHID